jgi:hypothetical protein
MREVIESTWGWDEAWQRSDFDRRLAAYVVSIIDAEHRAAGGLGDGIRLEPHWD